MADYIFIRKSRNALSSLTHAVLNLLLAVVSIWATVATGNVLIGLILIVVSKWRMFAVNHRYWWLNIRSSLVDLIVGVGFVMLAYAAGTTFLPVHFVLMAAYAVWLMVLKPRSTKAFTMVQALVAVLVGTTAATICSVFAEAELPAFLGSVVIVVSEFVIGYAASNHVLAQGNGTEASLASLMLGLVFGEIAWLTHSWLIIYTLGASGIAFSQLALILTVLAFAYFKIYAYASKHEGAVKFKNVALPIVFSVVVIAVLLIGFSQPRFNIH